jgi:hypothetical protein
MNRLYQTAWAVLLLAVLLGCAESVPGPVDGETHFLSLCTNDCGKGLACICGVCTRVCDDDKSCDALPGDPTCVAPDALEPMRVCQPSDPANKAVCDVGCDSNTDCKELGKEFTCQSGFCREPGTSSKDNPAATDSSADQESGTLERDADVLDAEVDAFSGLKETGVTLPQLPDVGDTGISTVAANDAASNTISGGLASGERAPKPGDVPSNAYGGPVDPMSLTAYYPRFDPMVVDWENLLEAGTGPCNDKVFIPWLPSESQPCIAYYLCSALCTVDTDCDSGGSGSAVPVCQYDLTGWCLLRCNNTVTCPDGMACVDGNDGNGSQCLWPVDVLRPECPGWCELDPTPQGCPGWCAAKGVGCKEGDTGYCCDGLVCGPDGYCIEEN